MSSQNADRLVARVRAMLPIVTRTIGLQLLIVAGGCPPDQHVPDRPPGPACADDSQCIPDGGPSCGVLPACVDQRCEAEPTRLVPCP